jgi:integrase
MKEELVETNPARDLDRIKTGSTGWHSWEVEEVRRYEERHPIGSKARLALALLMYTGVRRSDVVLLGRQHVRGGWLKFTTSKTSVVVEVPVLPELQRIIDDRRPDVPGDGVRGAVHGKRVWGAVSRLVQFCRPASVLGARAAEGCGCGGGGEWGDQPAAHGHLWMAQADGGGALHAGCGAQEDGGGCNGVVGEE